LTMSKNISASIYSNTVKSQPLAAVECCRICQVEWELCSSDSEREKRGLKVEVYVRDTMCHIRALAAIQELDLNVPRASCNNNNSLIFYQALCN
jgi:hypothetical protein